MKNTTPISANTLFAYNATGSTYATAEGRNDKNYDAFNGNSPEYVTTKICSTLSALPFKLLFIGLLVLWSVQPASGQVIRKSTAALGPVTKLLRLKLYVNAQNHDDIAIGFNPGATFAFDANEDSKYMAGYGALEGLASYSSDGVRLSVNLLPLPVQQTEMIRLYVVAAQNGPIVLQRTELDSLPARYSIWLVDRYKKDSINLRTDSSYVFNIDKADTASFGSYRLYVSVGVNPAAAFRLLGFKAIKAPGGAELSWTTQNEENATQFTVQRSIDGGLTFATIDTLTSTSTGTYSVTDANPPAANDIYRIKITAGNGGTSYSNTITLIYTTMVTVVTGAINIYPNPVSGMLNVAIGQSNDNPGAPPLEKVAAASPAMTASALKAQPLYNIKIITITGTVITNVVSPSGSWQGDVSALSPGTYILRVTNTSNSKIVGTGTFIKR